MSDHGPYISDFIKQTDRMAYTATVFVPDQYRTAVQSLWAFALDVAAVRARVSEPTPGEIRLQWWLDFLEGTEHGSAMSNPLAAGLSETISKYDLPTGPLRRMVAARRFDLYDDPMPSLNSFEGYAGETLSTVYQFSAMVLNGGNDAGAADAAGFLGVAHTWINVLRLAGQWSSRAQIWVPIDRLSAHGVSEQAVFAHASTPELLSAWSEFRLKASARLVEAEREVLALPSALRPAFATLPMLRARLRDIERLQNVPFAPPSPESALTGLLRTYWWLAFSKGQK